MSGGPLTAGMSLEEVTGGGIIRMAGSNGAAFSQAHVSAFHQTAPHASGAMQAAADPIQPEAPSTAQTADMNLTQAAKVEVPTVG